MKSEAQAIVESLNSAWYAPKYVFPGPQPVSIERKHIDTLKTNDYYIGYKNDGLRVALCLMRHDDKPRCFLLNRKLEITYIRMTVSKKMYNGCMFDCEMIDNQLYIFDCPLFAGKSLKTESFDERLSYCESFLSCLRQCEDYKICVKEFVPRCEYMSLTQHNKVDGFVFVPKKKHVQIGTHNTYYKWKPLLQNTIDFCVSQTGKVFLQNGGKLCNSKVTLDYSQCAFSDLVFKDETIVVECEYMTHQKWKVLHHRDDKSLPNSVYTFKRTLVNIEENILLDELVS